MKYIGKLLAVILLALNAVAGLLMLLSAYSPHVNPQTHPVWSCIGLFFPAFLLANLLFLCFWAVVYRRYALFPLLLLLCCWGSIRTYLPFNPFQGEKPEGAIKFLSYNTQAFGSKEAHTKEKSNKVLAYLQQSNADIICLQEYIWGERLKKKDIDYALREYKYKHYYPLGKGFNGLGCYSRYPILSATPIHYNSQSNGSIAYRIKVDKDTLLVINNHLESNRILMEDVDTYQEMVTAPNRHNFLTGLKKLWKKLAVATKTRSAQAEAVAEKVKESADKHIIVCGDFNDSPISYTHHILNKELNDAFVESGNGPGISYNKHRMYFRIDHILTSKSLKVYDCTVDHTAGSSDHYPIWCYVSLK